MIAPALEKTLHKAFVDARAKRHEFITVEHLLLGLLDDPDARKVLDACNADIESLRAKLTEFVEEVTPVVGGLEDVDTQPTLGFQRVVQRSIMHVQSGTQKQRDAGVTGANLLVAIFGEKDSHAVFFLGEQGINRLDAVNFVANGIIKEVEVFSFEARLGDLASESVLPGKLEPGTSDTAAKDSRLRVFISYSHLDAGCLERLLVHLRPLDREKVIDSWSDLRIRSGDKWRKELQENLKTAAVAVLLISADFLASDFIINDELPPLLVKAESDGLRLIPVVLKPCGYLRDRTLQKYQAINYPLKPLLGLPMIDQEFIYDKIAADIQEEIKMRLGK